MKAFQDLMIDNHCFGCGNENSDGLYIKSYWHDENRSKCIFTPEPHHAAGPRQFVNGGILATLIDCHAICTAIADGYRQAGRAMGEGEKIWYVTGNLTMNYLKPTPIVSDIEVWAEITKIEGRKTHMKCHVQHENHVTVEALVVGIQVPLSWLEEQSQLAQSSCV